MALVVLASGFGATHAIAAATPARFESTFRRIAIECSIDRYVFGVELRGLARPFEEDESAFGSPTVWITQQSGGVRAMAPRLLFGPEADGALPEVSFLAPPATGTLCPGVTSFKLPSPEPGRYLIALLFRENNRPYSDQLSVAVYDPVKHSIARTDRKLGFFEELTAVTSDGFSFRRASERSKAESGKLKFDARTMLQWQLSPIRPVVRWRWKSETSEVTEDLEATWKEWAADLPFINVNQFKPLTFWDPKNQRMKATTFAVAKDSSGQPQ